MIAKARTAALTVVVTLTLLFGRALPALAQPNLEQPKYDANAPGVSAVSDLAGLVLTYVLVLGFLGAFLCLASIIVGNIASIGRLTEGGKIGLLVIAVVMVVLGSVSALIMWFYRAGGGQ